MLAHRIFSLRFPVPHHLCLGCLARLGTATTSNTRPEHQLHIPVLSEEVVKWLNPSPGQVFLDMTFGAGGHTSALLAALPSPTSHFTVLALDRDSVAIEMATRHTPGTVLPLHGRFSDLPDLLLSTNHNRPGSIDLILMDLGVSSMQMDAADRGFALSSDTPLDMRMGINEPDSVTAAEVVNGLDQTGLARVFRQYGEERSAVKIADAIVDYRSRVGPIQTTQQLADIVGKSLGFFYKRNAMGKGAHVATNVFQALRILVNDELNELFAGLSLANQLLKPGGRCAVISFHSLEDRIVKRAFHGQLAHLLDQSGNEEAHWSVCDSWRPLTEFITPSREEQKANPRSRSAKLRIAEKV